MTNLYPTLFSKSNCTLQVRPTSTEGRPHCITTTLNNDNFPLSQKGLHNNLNTNRNQPKIHKAHTDNAHTVSYLFSWTNGRSAHHNNTPWISNVCWLTHRQWEKIWSNNNYGKIALHQRKDERWRWRWTHDYFLDVLCFCILSI